MKYREIVHNTMNEIIDDVIKDNDLDREKIPKKQIDFLAGKYTEEAVNSPRLQSWAIDFRFPITTSSTPYMHCAQHPLDRRAAVDS